IAEFARKTFARSEGEILRGHLPEPCSSQCKEAPIPNPKGRSPSSQGDQSVLTSAATEQGRVIFLESGLRFEADVLRGQKTGFFLDQRENRRQVETLAQGRKVLNAFSFSGGFSLYAARGGASSVTDLDI